MERLRRSGILGLLLAMVVLLFLSQAAISVGGGEAQREPFHPLMETAVRLRETTSRFWAELYRAWDRAWKPVWRAFSPVVWAGGGRLCGRAPGERMRGRDMPLPGAREGRLLG